MSGVITGVSGSTTRSSRTVMSSGPAMSSTKRRIVSDGMEPSSATSTFFPSNMAELLRGPAGPVRCQQWRLGGADQEDRGERRAQHGLGHAAEHEPAEPAAAVARHHDEVGGAVARGLHDRFG